MTDKLAELDIICHSHSEVENPEVMELNISEDGEFSVETDKADKNAIRLRKYQKTVRGIQILAVVKILMFRAMIMEKTALHSIMRSINPIQTNYKKRVS